MGLFKYVAFPQAIDTGKTQIVKADKLAKVFNAAGYSNVKTINVKGDILFESNGLIDEIFEERRLENIYFKTYQIKISIAIRTFNEIQSFIESDPFGSINIFPRNLMHLTLLKKK